jgi:hypothetical protein
MDLSIRVIALMLCATCVASHQDTHTYRLSKFLKITPQQAISPSAAEKRDYEECLYSRQEFFNSFHLDFMFPIRPKRLVLQKRCAL